ncbi:MAG: IS3 family transposase [Mycoplasmataceae bacterium]|nr:IS3 family transposase [Mycoplasmataceae bacterium]
MGFLKTEFIYNLCTKRISLKQLKNEIAIFIHYYNNVRIQKYSTERLQFNIKSIIIKNIKFEFLFK